MTTLDDLPDIYAMAQATQRQRQEQRFARPLIRLWDGNWTLRGIVTGEISADFIWMLNESGTGKLVLPQDHWLAQWATSTVGTGCQNVHITVDKNGARWSGRMQKATVHTDDQGIITIELDFLHDYEELKHICVWSNPLLPAIFQFPKDFLLADHRTRYGFSKPFCSSSFCGSRYLSGRCPTTPLRSKTGSTSTRATGPSSSRRAIYSTTPRCGRCSSAAGRCSTRLHSPRSISRS